MKKTKLFLTSAIMLAMFSVSATRSTKTVNPTTATALNSCGVSASDVASYLTNCSHHHTVYSVSQIPGTCNFTANVENGIISTVYVSGGSIIMHQDSNATGNLNTPQTITTL